MIRRLVPAGPPAEPVDALAVIDAEAGALDDRRAWVYVNMVTSLDGAATSEGRSGGLGGPGDRLVFGALRGTADVIVAGAETVRTEGYHLPKAPPPELAPGRAARGQAERPRLCIVTRRTTVHDAPLLDELPDDPATALPWQRPMLATIGPRPAGAGTYDPRFEVIELGADSVDLTRLVDELAARGLRRILCEGGPSLLAQLAADGLVDEWNFTISPLAVGGESKRPLHGERVEARLRLDRLLLDDDSSMFTRYLTARPDTP